MNGITQSFYAQENKLLLLCARTEMSQEQTQEVTSLTQKNLDWVYLLATANQHGILPLLFRNLSTFFDAIPPRYWAQLRTFYMSNSVRNEILANELILLLDEFKSEGIATLPFKGPALAAMAYGDISLRVFVDLDILVPQPQLTQAFHVMKEKGFLLKGHDAQEDQRPSSNKKTYTFIRGVGLTEIRVDLQSLIIGDYFAVHINDHSIWDRVTEIPMLGKLVPGLGAEDLLITLCIHGSKHFWEKTKWICDVAELIQRYQKTLNWKLVSEQADRLGVRNMLELGLNMAQILQNVGPLKDGISPEYFKGFAVSNQYLPVTAIWLNDQLFNQSTPNHKTLKEKAFYLFLRDDLSNHFRQHLYLSLIPLPRKYWNLLPHPHLFAFFYRSVFALRLCGKYLLPSHYIKRSIERWVKLVA